MMGKIGVDRSEELKNNWRGKRFRKTEIGKKTEKSKTVEQREPMNSQVIREISPEGTSGLWRVGFMENKRFWGENEKVQRWWKGRVVMLKLVGWRDQEKVMYLEEIDEVEADEKSQEVDSTADWNIAKVGPTRSLIANWRHVDGCRADAMLARIWWIFSTKNCLNDMASFSESALSYTVLRAVWSRLS